MGAPRATCARSRYLHGQWRAALDGRTSDFLFGIPQLIECITAFATLERGDVVMTGTPSGVRTVAVGDTMTIEVEGLGSLTNPVVAA
jgi:2-keto-4-pentenoate hydratase/2-oxohepta-3-ene-1,7-dioic acid hydratase in catechol pathway